MNFKEIKELIRIIDASGLSEICIEQNDMKLTLKKEAEAVKSAETRVDINDYLLKERLAGLALSNGYPAATVSGAVAAATIQAPVADAAVAQQEQKEEDFHYIKSPIVGVFYNSPNPSASAFVSVGDKVSQGQVLCIVEAMKMMNEITSDAEGEIVEILVHNQGTVEYGQPLFKIRKA